MADVGHQRFTKYVVYTQTLTAKSWERSGSVVECLTRDRRAAGSSLTGVTALWSLSKTHLSELSTGSTQEDSSRITERLLSGRKESNQTNYCKIIRKFQLSIVLMLISLN